MNVRFDALGVLGCALFTSAPLLARNDGHDTRRPNILFILADDYGWKDTGITGSAYYETPNIDRIAENGVLFSNSYSACSVSSPSRASILTGQTPARHGITNWIGDPYGEAAALKKNTRLVQPRYVETLPVSEYTLVKALKEEGYMTMIAGKWHLGDIAPEAYGFDVNAGGYSAGNPKGGYFSPYNNPALTDGEPGEDLSIRLANECRDFIRSQADNDSPFFVYLSFYAVHGPIETTEGKWRYFRDKAEKSGIADDGFKIDRTLPVRQHQDNPVYAGLISSMDEAVGIVLDELESSGMLDNTIVVFTSDNGGVSSGDNYSTSNLPLRGGKGRQWEGGTRVPLFIMTPDGAHGKIVDTPVIHMDLLPTILELAGIGVKNERNLDGVSLKPLLEQTGTIAERPLFWHYPHYGNQGGEPSSYMIENGWKLIHYYEDGRNELYNLSKDPSESTSVLERHRHRAGRMYRELSEWLTSTGASLPCPNNSFDEAEYQRKLKASQDRSLSVQEKLRKDMLSPDWSPNADWWGSRQLSD